MSPIARRVPLILLLSSALAIPPGIAAQVQASVPPSDQSAAELPADDRSSEQRDSTIIALRAQLETMRSYDQRLLATVYWALGGLVALGAVLIGFGWFANFRVYERDKAALRQELLGVIASRLAESESHLSDRVSAVSTQLDETARAAASQAISPVKQITQELQSELVFLKYQMYEAEFDRWSAAGVHTNSLRVAVSMISIAQADLDEFWVSKALDRMRSAFKSGARPDADGAREVQEVLDCLPPGFAADVQNLREALRASRS